MADATRNLYIVVTQSGSALSGFLKHVTGAPYNHVSISLEDDLSEMYSFGRLHPYNPLNGGFVMESPHFGTFKRFAGTDALVLCKQITEEQYDDIKSFLETMYKNKHRYRYNTIGLILAAFGIIYHDEDRFYCSEFVREVLVRFQVESALQFPDIVKPIDFLQIKDTREIYRGKLRNFKAVYPAPVADG